MPEVRFDSFYDYDGLTALVHGWAEERPDVFRVESIGRSYEERDIWLCTVTRFETGEPLEKPAFLVLYIQQPRSELFKLFLVVFSFGNIHDRRQRA